jgi:telomere length regulation protein
MKSFEQRKYINAVIAHIVKHHLSAGVVNRDDEPVPMSKPISGAAVLLHILIKDGDAMKEHLVSLLTRSTIASLDDSLAARRSVLSALAQDEGLYMVDSLDAVLTLVDRLHTLLENCIKLFGDSVYIKHTPVVQQEGMRSERLFYSI